MIKYLILHTWTRRASTSLQHSIRETWSSVPVPMMCWTHPTHFSKKICVRKVTIPQRNGRSLGYVFIKLSWAVGAPVKMSDICVTHSDMIFVNSCPIYFRELYDKVGTTTPPRESMAKVLKATTTTQSTSGPTPRVERPRCVGFCWVPFGGLAS